MGVFGITLKLAKFTPFHGAGRLRYSDRDWTTTVQFSAWENDFFLGRCSAVGIVFGYGLDYRGVGDSAPVG